MARTSITRGESAVEPVFNPVVSPLPNPILHRSDQIWWLRLRAFAVLFREALRIYQPPWRAVRVLHRMNVNRQIVQGGFKINKVAKVDNRYFFSLMAPGFPSFEFQQYGRWELQRLSPRVQAQGLQTVFFGITKKCPLRCEHCYEGENINRKERLTPEDLMAIVRKFQDFGTWQFFLEGGEPMMRFRDILQILKAARPGTDFWLISSGFGMTPDRATQLKSHGLTGVVISLDHHRPAEHNAFRGHAKAFSWAMQALVSARQAGLVTALSLCATPAYTQDENLRAYLELARQMGVAFVQILEALPVGRYADRQVALTPEQRQLLEYIYRSYNSDRLFRDYPIIFYPAYHQKNFGCFGGGNRSLYIDTDGDLQACPFCRTKVCHALQFPLADSLELLKARGCHRFYSILQNLDDEPIIPEKRSKHG